MFDFKHSYDKSWGKYKAKTKPSPGNHEYYTPGATGYFKYFSVRRYYSFNIGTWHLISLNSNIPLGEGTPQNNWLEKDLAAHQGSCVLAYWHHPRYSGGTYFPGLRFVRPLWKDLLRAHADLVLNGHDHSYQRYARMDNSGDIKARGLRQFIVGTGGKEHYQMKNNNPPGLRFADDTHFGVLKLTLHRGSYNWRFVAPNGSVKDSGRRRCV